MFVPDTAAIVEPVRDALFHLRYRDPDQAPPNAALWNVTLETLIGHRSVRRYLPDALPDGTLELLVAAAQSAATSSSLQVWSVVAVTDAGRRDRLAAFAGGQRHIQQAPLFLAWLADLRRLRALGEERGLDLEGPDYLEMQLVAMVDAALAAQNAAVAAESMGLGTVYIGGMRNHPEKVAAELGLPPNVFCVFGMCVGWPDLDAGEAVKPRLPQSVVLHREQYEGTPNAATIAAYDLRMREFQGEQRMSPADWSAQSVQRVEKLPALMGRERMREAMANLGFILK